MTGLFNAGKIGAIDLSNRMIRTASHEGLADGNGAPTEKQFEFYFPLDLFQSFLRAIRAFAP